MEKLSVVTHLLMILSTAFVVYQLYRATNSKPVVIFLIALATITAILGLNDFYKDPTAMPPRFIFLAGPGMLAVLLLFLFKSGSKFLDDVNTAELLKMQTVRLPIEIMLHQLFIAALIPQIMTFEGFNFDILTGLTAPILFYLVYKKQVLNSNWLLAWNIGGLILLFIIVTLAILSAATPVQQLAFDQPNIGVTYFPFVWLPAIVVPAALLGHLVSIRKILLYKSRAGSFSKKRINLLTKKPSITFSYIYYDHFNFK